MSLPSSDFQVEGNAPLVCIEGHEVVAVEARAVLAHLTSRVTAARRLDLDDVSSEPGEGLGTGGCQPRTGSDL